MNTPVEILLVEDNPNDVILALSAFEQHQLSNKIRVARDGEEALDYLFCRGDHTQRDIADRPKLILLDLKLPKIDGTEVLRQLKTDPRTRMIPVVLLTSSKEERDVVECYARGANSYIVKPVDFDQFIETARLLGMYWLLLNHPPVTAAETSAKGEPS